jgi:hypothetical protein
LGFIAGPYLTYNHAAVIPALLAGLILGVIAAIVFLGDSLAAAAGGAPGDWLLHSASTIARVRFISLAALILGPQLLLVLGMESAEQIAAFGHPLGLAAALGAPAFYALLAHTLAALIVAGAALLVSRAVTVAARVVARALGTQLRCVPASALSPCFARREFHELLGRRVKPLARRIANRPPPLTFSVA